MFVNTSVAALFGAFAVLVQELDGPSEARILHPSMMGYFAVMRLNPETGRLRQKLYPMAKVEAVADAMRSVPDAYISQASFVAPKRRVSLLQEIRTAFVDVDCYTLGIAPDEAFVERLIGRAREFGVPAPSYVVGSGRGVYLKWILREPVGALHLARWQALQAALVAIYKAVGADIKVKDAARVLRILGSSNSKTDGGVVSVLHSTHRDTDGCAYGFDDLCRCAAQVNLDALIERTGGERGQRVTAEVVHARGKVERLAQMVAAVGNTTDLSRLDQMTMTHEPIMMNAMSAQSLAWSRFVDLRSIAMARGGVGRGWRDHFLFWSLNFLALAGVVTADSFWQEARGLASIVSTDGDFRPMEDGSLGTLYRKVRERDAGRFVKYDARTWTPLYTVSNARLIELFGIEEAEQHGLTTIIDDREKRRRVDVKNPGRAQRREERARVKESVIEAHRLQMAVAEVAELTRRSQSTVRRVLAKEGVRPREQRMQRVQELISLGWSNSRVAQELGVSERTVIRLAGRDRVVTWQSRCAEMLAAGQSIKVIEAALGVSRASIYRFIAKSTSCRADGGSE